MELKIGFINIFEGCSFSKLGNPHELSYYQQLFSKHSFDLLFIAECPIDNKKGESTFVNSIAKVLGIRYVSCCASDVAFIGATRYSGIAILSRFPISQYHVIKYYNPKLSVEKDNGVVWHSHDKFIQSGKVTLPNGQAISIINTHVLPLTIFGHEMDSAIGMKIFSTLESTLDVIEAPLILAGDFNLKATPFPNVIKRNSSRLNFPTNSLRTSAVNEIFKGAQIATSKSLNILKTWAIPSESDCYLLGLELEIKDKA